MKPINFFVLLSIAFLFGMCNNTAQNNSGHGHEHTQGDGHDHSTDDGDHETYYTCEHHPEIHEFKEGKCSKCQMDLIVKQSEADKEIHSGHDNEKYYTCSDHPGVHENAGGKCSTCGKELVQKGGMDH